MSLTLPQAKVRAREVYQALIVQGLTPDDIWHIADRMRADARDAVDDERFKRAATYIRSK